MTCTFLGIELEVLKGDIANQPDLEAIVNAANAELAPGGELPEQFIKQPDRTSIRNVNFWHLLNREKRLLLKPTDCLINMLFIVWVRFMAGTSRKMSCWHPAIAKVYCWLMKILFLRLVFLEFQQEYLVILQS